MNLDAYMIRKIAPRLFFAVVGINLSIYLCVAAVDITTVAGHGIGQLIRGPFDAAGILNSQPDVGSSEIGGGALLVMGLLAGVPAIAGGLSTIFFLLLPVFVLILTTLFTIALRQALIVLLTMVSPIAIVLSVLPGTERYFKQWWDLFLKTLIVYPMIAAVFAISDVLTAINYNTSHEASNDIGAIHVVNGLLFAFLPLVLIPFVFRFAGGALGAFSNASRQLQSMTNRLSGQRLQQNWSKGVPKLQSYGLFTNPRERDTDEYDLDNKGQRQKEFDKDGNWTGKYKMKKEKYGVRHQLNRGVSAVANLPHMRLSRPISSISNARQIAVMKQAAAANESDAGKILAGLDDEHQINTASDGTREGIERAAKERVPERYDESHPMFDGSAPTEETKAWRRKNLADTVSRIQDFNKVSGGHVGRVASAVALHGISTSYRTRYFKKDKNGNVTDEIWKESDAPELKSEVVAQTSHDQMQETIRRVTGNDVGLANWVTVESVKGAKAAGRYDMAASASAVLMYQEALRSGDTRAIKEAQEYYKKMMKQRVTPAQMLQGHPRAAEEMSNVWKDYLGGLSGKFSGDSARNMNPEEMQAAMEEFERAMGDAAGIQDVLSSAAPESAGHFSKNVFGHKFTAPVERVVPVTQIVNGREQPVTQRVVEKVVEGDKVVEKVVEKPVTRRQIVSESLTGEEWATEFRDSAIFNQQRREYGRRSEGQQAEAARQAQLGGQITPPDATNPLAQ